MLPRKNGFKTIAKDILTVTENTIFAMIDEWEDNNQSVVKNNYFYYEGTINNKSVYIFRKKSSIFLLFEILMYIHMLILVTTVWICNFPSA